jgi:hypothetical protein
MLFVYGTLVALVGPETDAPYWLAVLLAAYAD